MAIVPEMIWRIFLGKRNLRIASSIIQMMQIYFKRIIESYIISKVNGVVWGTEKLNAKVHHPLILCLLVICDKGIKFIPIGSLIFYQLILSQIHYICSKLQYYFHTFTFTRRFHNIFYYNFQLYVNII